MNLLRTFFSALILPFFLLRFADVLPVGGYILAFTWSCRYDGVADAIVWPISRKIQSAKVRRRERVLIARHSPNIPQSTA